MYNINMYIFIKVNILVYKLMFKGECQCLDEEIKKSRKQMSLLEKNVQLRSIMVYLANIIVTKVVTLTLKKINQKSKKPKWE